MHLRKTRFVAACQQLLVMGVVVAALVPAASVVTLDVVRETPSGVASSQGVSPTPSGALAAYVKAALTPSEVATAPVDPTVDEVQLTAPAGPAVGRRAIGAATGAPTSNARLATGAKRTVVVSKPQPVTGFGTVGVTWEHGDNLRPSQVRVQLRTAKGGVWSGWQRADYDVDGPDGDSGEGKASRPGTMEALIGHVDQVQVRMTVTGAHVPPDLKLAVINPGEAPTAAERPALDTDRLSGGTSDAAGVSTSSTSGGSTSGVSTSSTTGGSTSGASTSSTSGASTSGASAGLDQAVLAAAAYTPKPQIYSRAQWGADESIRQKSSLHYAEVHGGFVHHTVNANDYTAAEVPAIIRSIYAYHVKSRGWSDIGYNFLIDRFGRIWEGRYGGVDRPVVGAHTENYNDYGFGVSAIGNFETGKPTAALLQAEAAVFAWKLSLHGISAAATNVTIGPRTFSSSIMGHRDTKSTACPGKYLYRKIPQIRRVAASLQVGWSGRTLESNLVGSPDPDLIVRDATTKEAYVVPTGAGSAVGLAQPVTVSTGIGTSSQAVISADLTGDGRADLVKVSRSGRMSLRPGDGAGHFGAAVRKNKTLFVGRSLVTGVGDLNGDGHNDLVAKITAPGHNKGRISIYLGRGDGRFTRTAQHKVSLKGATQLIYAGDVSGDGRSDLLVRTKSGLVLYRGTGTGRFGAGTAVAGHPWSSYDGIVGAGDVNGDGHNDLMVRDASGNGWVLPGDGAGGFGAPLGPVAGLKAMGRIVGSAPVMGQGLLDVVGRSGTSLQVAADQTVTSTGLGAPIDTGVNLANATQLLNAGDWNRDGNSDLITRNTDGNLYLYLGNGQGRFGAPTLLATGFGAVTLLSAAGDITGDGWPDLQGQVGGAMQIWPGQGTAGLAAGYVSHSAISATRQVAVGLWTADGAPDALFVKSKKTVLYPGNGPGGLTNPVTVGGSLSAYNWVIGVSNVRNSGHSGLIVRDASGSLYEIDPTAAGMLGTPQLLGSGFGRFDLAD